MTKVEDRPLADQSAAARKAMIDSQLRTSGVNADFVLARMGSVPREDFVPAAARSHAYIDRAIALDDGGQLAAPLFHGALLQEAQPSANDDVLVVDGGSGYLAELVRPLVKKLDAVSAKEAVLPSGKRGHYSLLLVDGAVEVLPEALAKRLAEGARIVTGLAEGSVTRLAAGHKLDGKVALAPLGEMGIPVLHAFDRPRQWSF